MAKRLHLKQKRVFSEPLKRRLVKQIEEGNETVGSVSKAQGVSNTSVYKWINRYSGYLQSGQTLVVQMESEAEKTEALKLRIAELEAALGRKQMELDFEKRYNIELKKYVDKEAKKKSGIQRSNGSGSTKGSTDTK